MSLRSMTGYGQAKATGQGIVCSVEARSVNRKQLDIQLGIPKELYALESQIKALVETHVTRGRIAGEISVSYRGDRQDAVVIDEDLAGVYIKKLKKAADRLGVEDDVTASMLLRLPDVVRRETPRVDSEIMWTVVKRALNAAMRDLAKARGREGARLQADLKKRLGTLSSLLKRIKKRAPVVAVNYKEALLSRLRDADISTDEADGRLLREIALYADRCDISEEITRLDIHFAEGQKLMQSRASTGRALDFLAQEMFREINTIGSKGNDSDIRKVVIDFKAELERFREQVQNIE